MFPINVGSALNGATNLVKTTVGTAAQTLNSVATAPLKPFMNDSAEISSQGMVLGGVAGKSGYAGRISNADLQRMGVLLQEKIAAVRTRLGKICRENNLKIDKEFSLGLDKNGRIVVNGDYGKKEELQRILRNDEQFKKMFVEARKLTEFLEPYYKQSKN